MKQYFPGEELTDEEKQAELDNIMSDPNASEGSLPPEDKMSDQELEDSEPTDEDTGKELDASEEVAKEAINPKPKNTADEINQESDKLLATEPKRSPASDDSDELEPESPQTSQLSKFQDYMNQYRKLQEQRSKGDLVNGLLAAGGKIGQSMAGKYSGNFTPDQSGIQMLQKMNERPVQDFEQGQIVQNRQMALQSDMAQHDPTSPQSKLVREYVNSRLGMKLADDVSAADAQMLLKTIGKPTKPNQVKYQKVNGTVTDPKTGKETRMSAIFDPSTGLYKDPNSGQALPGFLAEGLNPFQITTGEHGEKNLFNKSRPRAPVPLSSSNQFNGARSPQEVYTQLQPDLRKELNDKIVPNFNKLTEKTQQRIMHQAPIAAKLEEAQLNPAAYAQLQAELARFDVGDQRLAQQEFNMFATRHGYKGWADWIQKNSTGTISQDFAQDFAHTINNTVKGMQSDLNQQAEKHAQLLSNRLPPGQSVDPKLIAPLIYSGYKPVAEEKKGNKKIIKKGYNPTSNKTQLIYDDGTKEIVDGRQ